MRRSLLLPLCLLCVPGLVAPAAGWATPAAVVVDDVTPALKRTDDGWKVSVGLTNLTGETVTLTRLHGDPPGQPKCTVALAKPTEGRLPAAQAGTAEITYDKGCDLPKTGVHLRLAANEVPLPPVNAAPDDGPPPDWEALLAFVGALLVGLLVAGWVWHKAGWAAVGRKLGNLPATWTFGDSLVTNVTLLGGLLTGVVGSSSVLEAVFGKETAPSVALATVGAAIATMLIGAGTVLLSAAKSGEKFTVGGVLAAGAITLAGALGELFVVAWGVRSLGLGWVVISGKQICTVELVVWFAAVLLAALLLIYSARSLAGTLSRGLDPEPAPSPTTDMVAAAVLTAAMNPGVDAHRLLALIDEELKRQTPEAEAEEEGEPKALAQAGAWKGLPPSLPAAAAGLGTTGLRRAAML